MSKIKIELEVEASVVDKIKELTGESLKLLLEQELNKNAEAFIERMGYDNF